MPSHKKIDLSKIRTYSFSERATKSGVESFAKVPSSDWHIDDYLNGLPKSLKAIELLGLIEDIRKAQANNKAIILMMGAHSIKVGLSPIIIDLLNCGFISHLALNGAGIIHDYEFAFHGRSSEEVAETIESGMFGMVKETPEFLNSAIAKAPPEAGLGESAGNAFLNGQAIHIDYSIAAAAVRNQIPLTVHISIGADTVIQHPSFDAAKWGKLSGNDFLILAESCKNLNDGGVVINVGSAVVLPEVFLKALNVARNIYGNIANFSAANLDMIQHYRPLTNVVSRPTLAGGKRYTITGHFEIIIPLIAWALKEKV